MKKIALIVLMSALFTGCASVKMESREASAKSKEFSQPSEGHSGLYVYRDSFIGKAVTRNVWLDGKCLGESGPDVFFHTEVAGGQEHVIATDSEFSPNELKVMFEKGKNYFVRQYMQFGAFTGRTYVELIPEAEGKAAVAKLEMATAGTCSR